MAFGIRSTQAGMPGRVRQEVAQYQQDFQGSVQQNLDRGRRGVKQGNRQYEKFRKKREEIKDKMSRETDSAEFDRLSDKKDQLKWNMHAKHQEVVSQAQDNVGHAITGAKYNLELT